jgi:hypothetical protein
MEREKKEKYKEKKRLVHHSFQRRCPQLSKQQKRKSNAHAQQ